MNHYVKTTAEGYVHGCSDCKYELPPLKKSNVRWICHCGGKPTATTATITTRTVTVGGTTASQRVHKTKCAHLGAKTAEVFPPKKGLGDLFEKGLVAAGITKAGWAEAKAVAAEALKIAHDKEESCSSCEKKQKWWNAFGRKLGIGKKSAEIATLLNLEEGRTLPVYACEIHGRCVPTLGMKGLDGAPHSCQGCKEKQLVVIEAPSAE